MKFITYEELGIKIGSKGCVEFISEGIFGQLKKKFVSKFKGRPCVYKHIGGWIGYINIKTCIIHRKKLFDFYIYKIYM